MAVLSKRTRAAPRSPCPGAASHLACVEIFDLASVSRSVRSVSNNVRQSIPSVSANLRRKLPLIARRAVYDCAPLQIAIPDVLIQPHSATLGITFYESAAFPPEYEGDAFVALHGSWNRAKRTGYKVVRLIMKDGKPTGEYEDFLTGFVADDANVWGRPVDVAVARDGALLVTDDGNGAIWRVSVKAP